MENLTGGRWTPLAALTAAHHKIVEKDKVRKGIEHLPTACMQQQQQQGQRQC
jgi:hypothetical protein